jgi:hypothetical protein
MNNLVLRDILYSHGDLICLMAFMRTSKIFDLNDIPNKTIELYLSNLCKSSKCKQILSQLTLNKSWVKRIGRCGLPLSCNSMYGQCHKEGVLRAIKENDFDSLRTYIILFSPRHIGLNLNDTNDNIRKAVIAIFDGFEIDMTDANLYELPYAIFLLPIFGASDDLTQKVYDLLDKLQHIPFLVIQNSHFSYASFLKTIWVHDILTLDHFIKTYMQTFYDRFKQFCKKNDEQYKKLTIPESTIMGTFVY